MGAGQLDRPISLLAQDTGLDSFGQPSGTWTEYAKVYAELMVIGGAERIEAEQRLNRELKRFRIRWRAGVNTSHRLVWDGQTYEITGAREEDGRRRYIVLDAYAINPTTGSS